MDHCRFVSMLTRLLRLCDILCNITEVLDLWLQPPVPFILGEKRVLVEESVASMLVRPSSEFMAQRSIPRVESAHGVVALQPTIHDSGVSLFGDALLGHLGVDPVGVAPHFGAYLAELNRSRRVVSYNILESLVE